MKLVYIILFQMFFIMNTYGTNCDNIYGMETFSGADFQISGERLSMPNITSFSFVNAISCKDTIVFIVDENQLTKVLDVDSLLKPQGEEQLMLDAKDALAYKTIDNMEENTDGDYDVPYLFLMDPKDTLQYITTFPIQKPYTYELCTARFAWDSQNKIATKIFDAIRRLNLDTIVQKNEKYNYIWLVITSLEDSSGPIERWHKLSLLIKFEGVKPNLCLLTTDVNTIQKPENIWSWYDLHSVMNNDNNTFDFDVLSDSIESRQVAYALEKGDSVLMYDIKNYNFNKLRKCSGLLKKLRSRNACCCTETKNDTIILLDMTNCEGMTYYSQAWNTKRPGEIEMCRLVKDNVVFIDSESLVLEMYDKETSRYRYLCNTWALDQFQSEWTQRSNTRAGCWHYLVTRIIFADKKVHCIDFAYIK